MPGTVSGAAPDLESVAASYVLGTLEEAELRAVEQAAGADPALAAAIARWQARLAPLAALVPEAPEPAGLWADIAAGLRRETAGALAPGPRVPLSEAGRKGREQPGRAERQLRFWRLAAALALLAATGALGWAAWWRPGSPGPLAVATLTAPGSLAPPLAQVAVAADGSISLRPLRPISVAAGQSLALWALPLGATQPQLLGPMPPQGGRMAGPILPEGSQVMVTIEPAGGHTPGAAPGPTLFAGVVTALRDPPGQSMGAGS